LRAVKEWSSNLLAAKSGKNLGVRIFEGTREDFTDVEIVETKKPKENKEDPRLAMMRRRKMETA
jgi:hypothetical protein